MAQVQCRFNSMYGFGVEKTGQDLSNTKEPVFTEVPPFAYDEETGEFLNKSSFPKLVKTGEVDVQEKIQSYLDDVDIYKILEKVALSGDMIESSPLTNVSKGLSDVDITNIPNNIHDFDKMVQSNLHQLKKVSPELAAVILKEDSSEADLKVAISNYINSFTSKEEKEIKKESKEGAN